MAGSLAVQITRAGAAFALSTPSGQSHTVRCCDVPELMVTRDHPETASPWSRRLAHVSLAGERLLVRRADGLELEISTTELLHRIDERTPQTGASASLVIDGCGVLLTAQARDGDPLGRIADAAVVICDGHIAWLGPRSRLRDCTLQLERAERIDAGGRLVTPGLIDCHSHPLFGGQRAREFAMRASGRGYLEIAGAGGGIKATIGPTRSLSFADHVALTSARMTRALRSGTTTSEAKSGYDLSADGELRLLEIARAVDGLHPVDLWPTLLGAHVLPPEYTGERQAYVRLVAEDMIPRAASAGLARSVDVYCDEGAFTLAETRLMLRASQRAGLPVRAHAGQFADLGAAELLAEVGGLSADHLENVSERGIAALARANVVAVMLPGACVQLRMRPPPVAELRAAGVAMAVATDLNPGTSLCETLPIQMWLATTHYGMTVEEAWLGVTRVAAQALGASDIGVLRVGARADLAIWDAAHPADIPYRYGANLLHSVLKAGRTVFAGARLDLLATPQFQGPIKPAGVLGTG